jgi:hypothetical protein
MFPQDGRKSAVKDFMDFLMKRRGMRLQEEARRCICNASSQYSSCLSGMVEETISCLLFDQRPKAVLPAFRSRRSDLLFVYKRK